MAEDDKRTVSRREAMAIGIGAQWPEQQVYLGRVPPPRLERARAQWRIRA